MPPFFHRALARCKRSDVCDLQLRFVISIAPFQHKRVRPLRWHIGKMSSITSSFWSLSLPHFCFFWLRGHTPSTAGTFRRKFRKNSGKTPETLSERFLEFPSRGRLGCPKPCNSRHLKPPEHFQNSLPPSTAGDASFFRSGLRGGHGILSSTGRISELIGHVHRGTARGAPGGRENREI